MGLVRREAKPMTEGPQSPRGVEQILAALVDPSPDRRRAAARLLVSYPCAVERLSARLPEEPDLSVREAILTVLMRRASTEVVSHLIPYLSSEDPWLRNAVMEALPQMPEACHGAVERQLDDPDPDVRLFAVTILGKLGDDLAHARLVGVLTREPHVNVCAAAVEAMSEHGTLAAIPALRGLPGRFPDEPFIAFAAELSIARITARLS